MSGPEALGWLRLHARDWNKEIAQARRELKALRKIYNIDNDIDAYNRFLRTIGRPPNATAILAAIHLNSEMKALGTRHIELESRAFRVEQQLAQLALTNWSTRDKEILSDYYHGILADITVKLETLLNNMPVVGAIEVKH